jgi:hypothetical protein
MDSTTLIHAVVFENGGNWVAQCLEYDVATQARTLDSLLYELERIVMAHLFVAEKEGAQPFADIPKAPPRFWEMYRRARRTVRVQELPAPEKQPRPQVEVAFADAA